MQRYWLFKKSPFLYAIKFLSDISNLKSQAPKQIEILWANANSLLEKTKTGLAKITQYKENLEVIEPIINEENTIDETNVSNNSLML